MNPVSSITDTSSSPEPEHNSIGEKISALGCKRLEKFAALIPRIVLRDDVEPIHDARVWSRRLQQILSMLAPPPDTTNRQRKLMRELRRIRKVLGRPRNLDVIVELVQEKISAAGNPVVRDAWDQLRTQLKDRRARAIERSREKLRGLDIVKLAARYRAIVDGADGGGALEENLRQSIAEGLADWREAVATAMGDLRPEQVHALRIATKRLRYRLELLAELGDGPAKARIKSLRVLQDQMGTWHDRQILLQTCAEFLSRKDFLATHPGPARALLVEMERERRRADAAMEGLVKHAEKVSQGFGDVGLRQDNASESAAASGKD
jgi:CHAD domain-containing protein